MGGNSPCAAARAAFNAAVPSAVMVRLRMFFADGFDLPGLVALQLAVAADSDDQDTSGEVAGDHRHNPAILQPDQAWQARLGPHQISASWPALTPLIALATQAPSAKACSHSRSRM